MRCQFRKTFYITTVSKSINKKVLEGTCSAERAFSVTVVFYFNKKQKEKTEKGLKMMTCIGTNKDGEKIFGLGVSGYGIDQSGMILSIAGQDHFEYTKFYSTASINEMTTHKEIKSSIVDLSKVSIDGYVLDLIKFTLNDVPYIQVIKGSEAEEDFSDKIKALPLKNQFFARNEEAIVFIHIENSSAIIKNDHRPKFHKDNQEEGNKKLVAILKSISCQFEVYEDFEKLALSGQLKF